MPFRVSDSPLMLTTDLGCGVELDDFRKREDAMCKIDLTAKSGDWRWAGAMGYAGKKVARDDWEPYEWLSVTNVGWTWQDGAPSDHPPCGTTADSRHSWHLWQEPPPVEPARVRWKLIWKDDALRVTGWGACNVPADALPMRQWDGYRFVTFWGHRADGSEIQMGALPVVYGNRNASLWRSCPTEDYTVPIYADSVEMVRVEADHA